MQPPLSKEKQIAAIVPRYTLSGNITVVMNTDGSQATTSLQTRTLLRRLAYSQAFDLHAVKKRSSVLTQRAILQPLPLSAGLVLFPVKTRIPRIPGDTTTGYVNLHAVSKVCEEEAPPYQSLIHLTGGWKLPVIWSAITVKKHLQEAKLSAAAPLPASGSHPELHMIAQKLVEIFYEILTFKKGQE